MRFSSPIALPLAAACAGLALFSVMDAVMKGLVLTIGAFAALYWRFAAGTLISGILYFAARPAMPPRATLVVHVARSAVVAVMAIFFFWGIGRVPLAQAIALSFIAPLIALGLAAVFLKERIGARSLLGSLMGLSGVGVIFAGGAGSGADGETLLGMGAVLLSAVFYAVSLVIGRHQAQIARPMEIVFFQCLVPLAILSVAAPWLLVVPPLAQWPLVALAALLAIGSLLFLSWAYARAEAQVLLPVEYTAFVWAAIMGWLFFREPLTLATLGGAVLIVAGCLLAARRPGGALEGAAA
jgi:S-adenosylmethionine uptake transporter